MDTKIERKFFYAYDNTEWIEDCVYWIKIRRGLSACTEETESKRHWYEEELPAKIKEWADSIRAEVCGKRSPLMEEITANIDSLTDERERERYIFSLLSPFGEYVERTNIDEKITRISQNIEEDREQIVAWREVVEDEETPQDEKEFGKGAIETLSELIDKGEEELVRKQKEQETLLKASSLPHGETEKAFRRLCAFVTYFGVALDAHLLERRIDLLRYESIAGIKLVGKSRMDSVGDYLGSKKLAQYYIDALPKLDEQDELENEPTKAVTEIKSIAEDRPTPTEAGDGILNGQGKKGKQIVPFSTLNDDGGYKRAALKEALTGKKGRGAALITHCAKKLGWTNTIEFGSIKNLMGEVYFGVESGYTRYKTKADFTNTEITDTMKWLNQLYCNLKQGK